MMSKDGSLRNFKILVTGSCGFLGTPLVKALLDNGAFVLGVDHSASYPGDGVAEYYRKSFKFIAGEIFEKLDDITCRFMEEEREKSAVFHFAGMANAGLCAKDPSKAFQSNVFLTQQVLEFCRLNHIEKFIFPSTGIVYIDRLNYPAKETDPTTAKNFYAATKLTAEALIKGYAESFMVPCIIARLGNIYGPTSNADTIVGTVVRQALKSGNINIRDYTPVRDFIYIDDVIEGFLNLLVALDDPGYVVLNLSTGIGTAVKKMAETVCKLISIPADISQSNPSKSKHISKLALDNSLLWRSTGWKPKYDLYQGLSRTLASFKAYYGNQ